MPGCSKIARQNQLIVRANLTWNKKNLILPICYPTMKLWMGLTRGWWYAFLYFLYNQIFRRDTYSTPNMIFKHAFSLQVRVTNFSVKKYDPVELLLQLQFTIGKKVAGQLYWHLRSSNWRISQVRFWILIQDLHGHMHLFQEKVRRLSWFFLKVNLCK